jgi:hypothetical protein
MLTNEEIEKEMNELVSVLSKEGLEADLIYTIGKEVGINGKTANLLIPHLSKQPFATYPMITITLVNKDNGQNIIAAHFQSQNKAGFKLSDYKTEGLTSEENFFQIEELHNFLKDVDLKGIDFSIYEKEKEGLETELSNINKILQKKNQ